MYGGIKGEEGEVVGKREVHVRERVRKGSRWVEKMGKKGEK